MNVAPDLTRGTVNAVVLADGMLVRLAGDLDDGVLPGLRGALLSPRPRGCEDVIVDAGHVDSVTDDVLAVLVAANAWAAATGARFRLSAMSLPVRLLIDQLDLYDALPVLDAAREPATV